MLRFRPLITLTSLRIMKLTRNSNYYKLGFNPSNPIPNWTWAIKTNSSQLKWFKTAFLHNLLLLLDSRINSLHQCKAILSNSNHNNTNNLNNNLNGSNNSNIIQTLLITTQSYSSNINSNLRITTKPYSRI